MTDPLWRRVASRLLMLLWFAVCFGWADVLSGMDMTAGALGGFIGAVAGGCIQRRSWRRAEAAYEALDREDRGVIDDALTEGTLRGPIELRQVERDLAQARLSRAGAPMKRRVLGWAALSVLFVLLLWFAPSRPPLLVAGTVVQMVGWAVLALAAPSACSVTEEERTRLKSVSKAPV